MEPCNSTEIKLLGVDIAPEFVAVFRSELDTLGILGGEIVLCGLPEYPLTMSMVWKAPADIPVAALLPIFVDLESARSVAMAFYTKWQARIGQRDSRQKDDSSQFYRQPSTHLRIYFPFTVAPKLPRSGARVGNS